MPPTQPHSKPVNDSLQETKSQSNTQYLDRRVPGVNFSRASPPILARKSPENGEMGTSNWLELTLVALTKPIENLEPNELIVLERECYGLLTAIHERQTLNVIQAQTFGEKKQDTKPNDQNEISAVHELAPVDPASENELIVVSAFSSTFKESD